jgi:serine/threonine protein kinase
MLRQKIAQYRVIERLGKGGMGTVYRAVDEMLGREVALKIIDTTLEGSTARLRAEATALARLSHPGIATVHELIEDDTRLVMAMELVRGETLQDILEHVGAFSPRRAAELCMQALAVLEHAHAAGVVHRDLKPGNLMITQSGSVKILDFGIARFDGSVNLTNAGVMVGTPAYMAPEQVLGHPVDARTDLYAMGVVFFRLVTAAFPFKGENPFDMAQCQVNDVPAKAADVRTDLPEWVDDIVARSLAKKPADRFQSAMQFHETLARALSDIPQSVPKADVEATEVMPRPDFSTAPVPVAARKPRLPQWAWLLTGAAVALVAGMSAFRSLGAASTEGLPSGSSPLADTAPRSDTGGPEPNLTTASQSPNARGGAIPAPTNGSAAPIVRKPAPTPVSSAPPTDNARPVASFSDVKFLAVNGPRTSASDVEVQFSDVEVSVRPRSGKTSSEVLPYQAIAKATYARGRDPKWDPALSGPVGRIDVPGILGRARHWLVLQGPDRYLILRLDGDDRLEVMKAFEERTGIVIDRTAAKQN